MTRGTATDSFRIAVNRPQSDRVLRTVQSSKLPLGFTHRPDEYGLSRRADRAGPGDFDAAIGMLDLASKLGAYLGMELLVGFDDLASRRKPDPFPGFHTC